MKAFIALGLLLAVAALIYSGMTWLLLYAVAGIWETQLPFWPVFAGLIVLSHLTNWVRSSKPDPDDSW